MPAFEPLGSSSSLCILHFETNSPSFFQNEQQGHAVEERSCPKPMEYAVDQKTHAHQTVSSKGNMDIASV